MVQKNHCESNKSCTLLSQVHADWFSKSFYHGVCNQATGHAIQHIPVPVPSQDKLGGLQLDGHPTPYVTICRIYVSDIIFTMNGHELVAVMVVVAVVVVVVGGHTTAAVSSSSYDHPLLLLLGPSPPPVRGLTLYRSACISQQPSWLGGRKGIWPVKTEW